MHATIIDNCTNLEILRQFLAIVVLIEALWEDLVPHLDSLEIHFKLLGQLNFWHISP